MEFAGDHDSLVRAGGAGGFLARLGLATQELVVELGISERKIHCGAEIDVWFLAFLRLTSRFSVLTFGPVTINVATVEAAVLRSIEQSADEADPRGINLLTELIRAEWARSGRRSVEDLHVLLAFMRLGEGVAGQVFGELGISPKQVEDYALRGEVSNAARNAELLYSPEEAARYLQMNVQTVREWIRMGRLRAFRLAGQRALRIKAHDLQSVLEPVERAGSDGL